jgi:hypothetical protein
MVNMTKLNCAKELKDVLDGTSAHTIAIVEKTKKGWEIETSIVDMNVNQEASMQRKYKHCCNEITLKEVIQMLNTDF